MIDFLNTIEIAILRFAAREGEVKVSSRRHIGRAPEDAASMRRYLDSLASRGYLCPMKVGQVWKYYLTATGTDALQELAEVGQ